MHMSNVHVYCRNSFARIAIENILDAILTKNSSISVGRNIFIFFGSFVTNDDMFEIKKSLPIETFIICDSRVKHILKNVMLDRVLHFSDINSSVTNLRLSLYKFINSFILDVDYSYNDALVFLHENEISFLREYSIYSHNHYMISKRMGKNIKTVMNYKYRAMQKLGVDTGRELFFKIQFIKIVRELSFTEKDNSSYFT